MIPGYSLQTGRHPLGTKLLPVHSTRLRIYRPRAAGASFWSLDLEIGRLDLDTGTHDGEISWELSRGSGLATDNVQRNAEIFFTKQTEIREFLAAHPFEYTKTQVRTIIGGNGKVFNEAWLSLVNANIIEMRRMDRAEAGIMKTRDLWGPRATTMNMTTERVG